MFPNFQNSQLTENVLTHLQGTIWKWWGSFTCWIKSYQLSLTCFLLEMLLQPFILWHLLSSFTWPYMLYNRKNTSLLLLLFINNRKKKTSASVQLSTYTLQISCYSKYVKRKISSLKMVDNPGCNAIEVLIANMAMITSKCLITSMVYSIFFLHM